MSDPLSLTASAAGLIGLAGQILEGCLFLKSFMNEAKNASKDIRLLQSRLEMMTASTTDFQAILIKYEQDGMAVQPSCIPALEECANALNALKGSIQKDIIVCNKNGPNLWQKLRIAGGKNDTEKQLKRLDRASSQLRAVQSNIITATLHSQGKAQDTTNMILERVVKQGSDATKSSDRLQDLTSKCFKNIDGQMAEVLSSSHKTESLMSDGFRDTACLLQNLKLRMEVMVRGGFQEHLAELRFSSTRVNLEDQDEKRIGITSEKTALSTSSADHLINPSHPTKLQTYRSYYTNLLFNLEIVSTVEVDQQDAETNKQIVSSHHRGTIYRISLKLPFIKKIIELDLGKLGPYSTGFNLKFCMGRTHQFGSRQYRAFISYDVHELQNLFEEGLASPFDEDEYGNPLLDNMFMNCLWDLEDDTDEDSIINCFRFLIKCLGDSRLRLRPLTILNALVCWNISRVEMRAQKASEALMRLAIQYSENNPLDDIGIGGLLSVEDGDPIHELIVTQEIWPFDWDDLEDPFSTLEDNFPFLRESDRMILKDLEAEQLKKRVGLSNFRYQVIVPQLAIYQGIDKHPIHDLLTVASRSRKRDIKIGCRARISVFLKAGWSPRVISFFALLERPSTSRWRSYLWHYPTTPTQCAIELNCVGIWISALQEAGWEAADTTDLLDEEYYAGVTELLSGDLNFMSRDECRESFVEYLCKGAEQLINLSDIQKHMLAYNLGIQDQVYPTQFEITRAIEQAWPAYNSQTSIPGCWSDEGEIRLIPGVDFELPVWDYNGKVIDWSPYI